jgi:hypothetical protein
MQKEQTEFLAVVKQYEELKKGLDEVRKTLEEKMLALGFGAYVQCANSGTVYKIVKPNGTFIYFRDVEYVRTAQEGERAGTLSKKEAEGAGFILGK